MSLPDLKPAAHRAFTLKAGAATELVRHHLTEAAEAMEALTHALALLKHPWLHEADSIKRDMAALQGRIDALGEKVKMEEFNRQQREEYNAARDAEVEAMIPADILRPKPEPTDFDGKPNSGARVIRTWPSKSNPAKSHELREGADGIVYCTCRGWAFSKARPKTCRHMKEWAETVASGGRRFTGGRR